MLKETKIDYLVYNSAILPQSDIFIVARSPLRNYDKVLVLMNGVKAHTGHNNSDKYHIVCTGTTLDYLRETKTDHEIIDTVITNNGRISRLDIAVTQYLDEDGLITLDDFVQACKDYEIVSKHAKYGVKSVHNAYNDSHETCYVGDRKNRGKRGIFRAYDKGLEMNLESYLISRFELEEKRDAAIVSARRIADGNSLDSVLKSRFDLPQWEAWQQLLDAPSISVSRGKAVADHEQEAQQEASAKKWHWLLGTIAPIIGKQLAEDTLIGIDLSNWKKFVSEVKLAYDDNMIVSH